MRATSRRRTFGQACFEPGSAKNTYGTGCFMLLNTGEQPVPSENGLLTTVGWQLGGKTTYCLEGSVFIAGAVVQWLRDGLGIDQDVGRSRGAGGAACPTRAACTSCPPSSAWARRTGIRTPAARSSASRAARTAATSRARPLESMAFQTRDVLDAMRRDAGVPLAQLKVDGGASVNNGLMQFQADMLGVPVRRPVVAETTALGAAYLAGLAVGYWSDRDDIARNWALDREFTPAPGAPAHDRGYARWKKAVSRALDWEERGKVSARS